jgi:hypothetical protein
MSSTQYVIQPGMEVFGCDAEHIGRVGEVRADSILVEAPKGAGPVTIPRDVISEVSEAEHRIDLSLTASDIQNQSWTTPTV